MSVTRLLRKLNLRPRTRSGNGGSFAYYDAQSGSHLLFRWDGSGLTKSDEIVLFEEEGPGFQPLHIQGHLTRVLFMIRSGDGVFSWVRIGGAAFGGGFPPVEYRRRNVS